MVHVNIMWYLKFDFYDRNYGYRTVLYVMLDLDDTGITSKGAKIASTEMERNIWD